jgi:hypothetical protein
MPNGSVPQSKQRTPSEQSDTMAKLKRLYDRTGPRPDAFGRRQALPSEIERLIETRQPPNPKPSERRR